MSDSEDDFMSDKFLVEALKPRSESEESYTARRSAQQLRSLRAGQAKQLPSLKQKEEEQRRAGLATSLFDSRTSDPGGSFAAGGGGGGGGGVGGGAGKVKAMEMMMKMGWKVGEGLGRKRSPTPEVSTKRVKSRSEVENGDEDEAPRGGIGSSSRPTRPTPRTEPIRISMWAGRKGLSARSPSPPPLINFAGRNPDALDPRKMARLEGEAESFRERQRREFGEREVERKEGRAREMLVSFDRDKGVKFHPLHVLPTDPLGTLPRPVLKLIYPAQALAPTLSSSRSPSPDPVLGYTREKNVPAAERLRDQMRRDMLADLGDEEDDVTFGRKGEAEEKRKKGETGEEAEEMDGVNWEEMVSPTKRVLSMDPAAHLTFLVSQLRHEHLYCFWCAYKYRSWDELEGTGGCPGEDEDDH